MTPAIAFLASAAVMLLFIVGTVAMTVPPAIIPPPRSRQELHGAINRVLAAVGPDAPALKNPNYTLAWDRLAELTDTFGPRPAGSKALEAAIDWMAERAKADGFEVHTEDVEINFWERGKERATLITPTWTTDIPITALGFSSSTPPEGIEAEVVVVRTFDELDRVGKEGQVKGKIVLFNFAWTTYGEGTVFRRDAAKRTANWGGIAALIRSVTPYSMRSPHTGYSNNHPTVPAAAISVEDANIIARIAGRVPRVAPPRMRLVLESKSGESTSRNLVIDLPGTDRANEVLLVGGHVDSWDLGVGAVDDGCGFMVAYQALYLAKTLGFRPQRTLRAVLWTAEEVGVQGGWAYYNTHKPGGALHANETVLWAVESDNGVFTPKGLSLKGKGLTDAAWNDLQKISRGLKKAGARGWRVDRGWAGADVEGWCELAICGEWISDTPSDVYFRYHHAPGDMMDALDPLDLEEVAATFLVYFMFLT